MYDKLVTSARRFYLQRALNFISKCGGIELCFKLRGPVKRRCHFRGITIRSERKKQKEEDLQRAINFISKCGGIELCFIEF